MISPIRCNRQAKMGSRLQGMKKTAMQIADSKQKADHRHDHWPHRMKVAYALLLQLN